MLKEGKTVVLLACDVLVLGCLALYGAWVAAPHFCGDADVVLLAQTPVRRYFDRSGQELLLEPTYDYQYRIDVPLSSISEPVKRVIQGAEDGRFYRHDGVDRLAILRSLWLNVSHGRVKSGASTITMQLTGLVLGRERTFRRKWLQAGMARRMEWRHTKDWLLENYLNRIPFGGKIYGIEAAARYYFGMSASMLNMAEASLLCGLPQRPNAYRPDRHLPLARGRQRRVLTMLEDRGVLGEGEGKRIYDEEPLRFRDFRMPSPLKRGGYRRTEHILMLARREAKDGLDVYTSLEPTLQGMLWTTLREQVRKYHRVRDGAGVIVDNSTGEVLALVGTLDYDSPLGGQVNAATSRRNPGSVLKPFIYAEAIDGGLLCGETLLSDRPLRYGSYAPGNYDGRYMHGVTATEALSKSLNTPVVRLVSQLGAFRVLKTFGKLGLLHRGYDTEVGALAREYGLSLALGTIGVKLVDVVAAYRLLAIGGSGRGITYLRGGRGRGAERRVYTAGTCALVTKMLASRGLPGGLDGVSWKTGTSTGNVDAWCVGYTKEYTVGVWFGNKDGATSQELVGADVALPVVSSVLASLYRNGAPGVFDIEGDLDKVVLCRKTGLRAGGMCMETTDGVKPRGIPLRSCGSCGMRRPVRQSVQILRPMPGRYVAGRNGRLTLNVESVPGDVYWYVDGKYIGELPSSGRLSFGLGRHQLHAVSPDEGVATGSVRFEVVGRGRQVVE